MFGLEIGTDTRLARRAPGAVSVSGAAPAARPVALLADGRTHGAVTRLITPWSIGELTTPFVFLDYAQAAPESSLSGARPHPGVATLTLVLNGTVSLADAAGTQGELGAGGCAWMQARHGSWRGRGAAPGDALRVFQLWIALPSSREDSAAPTETVPSEALEEDGPVRVILGRSGQARSRLRGAPPDLNCFHVRLRDGQRWRYQAPAAHNVAWLAVDRGGVQLPGGACVYWEQIAVFGDSRGLIEVEAAGETSFLLGSAVRQPQALAQVDGTSATPFAAITQGDAQLARLAPRLRTAGRGTRS